MFKTGWQKANQIVNTLTTLFLMVAINLSVFLVPL